MKITIVTDDPEVNKLHLMQVLRIALHQFRGTPSEERMADVMRTCEMNVMFITEPDTLAGRDKAIHIRELFEIDGSTIEVSDDDIENLVDYITFLEMKK